MSVWLRCDGAADCPHVTRRWYRHDDDDFICFDCQRAADIIAGKLYEDGVPIFAPGDKGSDTLFYRLRMPIIFNDPRVYGAIMEIGAA